jgi:transcriptional regulator
VWYPAIEAIPETPREKPMYIPSAFRISETSTLHDFIDTYAFATLVSKDENGSVASHLPLALHRELGANGTLVGHMARANAHWRSFDAEEPSLAIFHGPHAYISPSWYVTQPAVPTWNYAVAHAYGQPRLIEDAERIRGVLDELVERYESPRPEPWANDLPEKFRENLQRAIVAFEMPIERLDGKWKLTQNRSETDQRSALSALRNEAGDEARVLSEFWQAQLGKTPLSPGD